MAMASSLEVRSPLLDHHIIEFAATLPTDLKFRHGTAKYLLKQYAERRAPASAIRRPKQGFSIPLADWLRADLRPMADDLLLSDRSLGRGYFEPDVVRGMWTRHQERTRNHGPQLWALMMLEQWHRMFVDQTPTAPPVGAAG